MSTFNSENLAVKFDIKPGLYDLKILFYIHPYHQLNLGSLHYKWLLPSSTQNAGPRSRIDMKLMILVTGGLRIPKFILSRARMNQNCTYTPPPSLNPFTDLPKAQVAFQCKMLGFVQTA